MALRVPASRVLKDALAYPDTEPFESSLGRSVRRHGGEYAEYLDFIARVRETARDQKLSLRDAARRLADQP